MTGKSKFFIALGALYGLLGGAYIELQPGGAAENLQPGDEIEDVQGAVSLLSLMMKFVDSQSAADEEGAQ